MSIDDAVLALADRAREHTRAARHARSLPLLCSGLGLLALAWVKFDPGAAFVFESFIPVAVFLALYLVMSVRRQVTGLGMGTDGYGIVLVMGGFVGTFLLPWSLFLGALFFLGVGLVILGWRGQDRGLWVPGAVVVATSPLVTFYVFDNHAQFLGARPSALVIAAGAVVLVVLGVRAYLSERALVASTESVGR